MLFSLCPAHSFLAKRGFIVRFYVVFSVSSTFLPCKKGVYCKVLCCFLCVQHIPSLQQKLIPELEDRLMRRCENLVSVHHASTLTGQRRFASETHLFVMCILSE